MGNVYHSIIAQWVDVYVSEDWTVSCKGLKTEIPIITTIVSRNLYLFWNMMYKYTHDKSVSVF